MNDLPQDLLYTKSHEWVRRTDDGSIVIGITDHAQEALGDMVFIELPEAGMEFEAGADMAVVESVKAASDIYAPVSGIVEQSNDALVDAPETINTDPFGEGWFLRMSLADASQLDGLMDAEAYAAAVTEQDD